jgi:hypothetical protein
MDTSADQSADGRWLSYGELADLRGIDHHSARRLTFPPEVAVTQSQ